MLKFSVSGISTMIAVLICCSSCQGSLALVENGKSDYSIVLSKDASLSERHAAEEFRSFIRQISGAELPVGEERDPLPGKMVIIGDGQALRSLDVSIDFNDLGNEGFAIRTVGPHLVIAGGRLRGTMYGVYTFLEDILGCRWYSSKVSHVPTKHTIILDSMDIIQKPAFEYRDPFFFDAFDPDYAARNKVNGPYTRLDHKRGYKLAFGSFAHTFYSVDPKSKGPQLVNYAKYHKEHPEYFSLIDGKRSDGYSQLCLTNPDVVRISTQSVLKWIRDNPQESVWSVSQNDNDLYCQCDDCKAVDEEEGSHMGTLLRFVNAIADEVAKERPDIIVDTLSYTYTLKLPKITRPRPNVRVRVCGLGLCEVHPYETCSFKPKGLGFGGGIGNAEFLNLLDSWCKVTNNIYIWHYSALYHHLVAPFPILDGLSANVAMYHRKGVKGVMFEGSHNPDSSEWMKELHAYLLSKLLWNPYADAEMIIEDFLQGYYGSAGKPIGEFLDILHDEARNRPDMHVTTWPDFDHARTHNIPESKIKWPTLYLPYMTPEVMAAGDRLLNEAESVADTPEIQERVRLLKLGLEYVRVMERAQNVRETGDAEEKAAVWKEVEAYFKKLESHGLKETVLSRPLSYQLINIAAQLEQKYEPPD